MFEHIELPAKLLDYFLRSNKSNINMAGCLVAANGYASAKASSSAVSICATAAGISSVANSSAVAKNSAVAQCTAMSVFRRAGSASIIHPSAMISTSVAAPCPAMTITSEGTNCPAMTGTSAVIKSSSAAGTSPGAKWPAITGTSGINKLSPMAGSFAIDNLLIWPLLLPALLQDLRWCIRHHSSVEKSAGLNKFGLSAGPRFDSGRKLANSNQYGFEPIDPQARFLNYCFQ